MAADPIITAASTAAILIFIILRFPPSPHRYRPDILDDDRRNNARLFEEHFYAGKGHIPEAPAPAPAVADTASSEPAADMATLLKMLSNPETAAMLKTLTAMLNPDSKQ